MREGGWFTSSERARETRLLLQEVRPDCPRPAMAAYGTTLPVVLLVLGGRQGTSEASTPGQKSCRLRERKRKLLGEGEKDEPLLLCALWVHVGNSACCEMVASARVRSALGLDSCTSHVLPPPLAQVLQLLQVKAVRPSLPSLSSPSQVDSRAVSTADMVGGGR